MKKQIIYIDNLGHKRLNLAREGKVEELKYLMQDHIKDTEFRSIADQSNRFPFACNFKTVYLVAIANGHIDIIKYALDNNVYPYYLQVADALEKAIENNHLHIINFFVDLMKKDKIENPKILSLSWSDKYVSQEFYKLQSKYDYFLGEMLCVAVKIVNIELAKYLIENGANVQYRNNMPLYDAVCYKNE